MNVTPNIAEAAKLITDPSRAAMLTALLDDRFYTASELAGFAGVKQQTASFHLAKLADADMVVSQKQGRHRYYRLKHSETARILETLLLAAPPGKSGPSANQQRTGRSEKPGHATTIWPERLA